MHALKYLAFMQVVFITVKRIIIFIAATNTAGNYLSCGDSSQSDNSRNCKGAADMLSSNAYCRADDEKKSLSRPQLCQNFPSCLFKFHT